MRKLICISILIATLNGLSNAQEIISSSIAKAATVWLYGSGDEDAIIKKKTDIEAMGYNVFINDVAEREKRHSIKTIASGDEKFDRIFREARELMDKEEWKQAAAKFSEIACDCPENKQADAALYWLAYCYNRQKMSKEANSIIDRLLKNSPNSLWADDARVLRYQIAGNNWTTAPAVSIGQGGSQSIYDSFEVFTPARQGTFVTTGTTNISSNNQIDREDEIKLAAFRSLLAADPKRGIEAMANFLRSDSKASETLKIQALRILRNSRYYLNHALDSFSDHNDSSTDLVKQLNLLLRDTLIKAYPGESSLKVRAEILYAIAYLNDEASVNYLGQLYQTESNRELKKAVINSFALVPYSFAAMPVARVSGQYIVAQEPATASSNPRKTTTPATNPVRELRFSKLMEIFRSEKDLELKRLAFSNLQRFNGWSSRDGMVEMLTQLYEAETDEKFKQSIIQSFGNLKDNQSATAKLLSIAKNDKSDKMRLEAIYALRNNKSPEIIKFLEDLIK